MAPPKTPSAARGTIIASSAHGVVSFSIRACPIPTDISQFVMDNRSVLTQKGGTNLNDDESPDTLSAQEDDEDTQGDIDVARKPTVRPERFWGAFEEICAAEASEWTDIAERVWAFDVGGCILVDARTDSGSRRSSVFFLSVEISADDNVRLKRRLAGEPSYSQANQLIDLDTHIEHGFRLATSQGPLCAEPMEGMAFFLESVEVKNEALEKEIGKSILIICG